MAEEPEGGAHEPTEPSDEAAKTGQTEVPSLSQATVWTLIAVTGVWFLAGIMFGVMGIRGPIPPILFTAGGILLVIALIVGATLGEDLSDEMRVALGAAAGLVVISWSVMMWYGWYVATQSWIWTCGTAIALPSVSAFWGSLGIKEAFLQMWGIEDPAKRPLETTSSASL